MTPITVNGHNLLVIDVPQSVIIYDIVYETDNTRLIISDENGTLEYIGQQFIPFGFKHSIIGTISKEGEFSFDPSDYVELHQITRLMIRGFKNYVKTTETQTDFTCKTSKESFISLLKSAGIYLSNPMGEKPDINDPDPHSQYYGCQMDDLSKWESYESKTIKGQVLILKQEKV